MQLIDEDGKPLGIVDTYRALEMARERNLDLAEVAPHLQPPLCKLMDYGKYLYAKAKQERGRKIKKSGLKGVRIGFRISPHDLEFKAAQADKFLSDGYKVRVELRLRGREYTLKHLAREKLTTFFTILKEPYKFERPVENAPRGLSALISREKSK